MEIRSLPGVGVGEIWLQRDRRELSREMGMFHILIMVVAKQGCTLVKTHPSVHLQCVGFIAYKSYFNKVNFKRKKQMSPWITPKGAVKEERIFDNEKIESLALQGGCKQDKSPSYIAGTLEKWRQLNTLCLPQFFVCQLWALVWKPDQTYYRSPLELIVELRTHSVLGLPRCREREHRCYL